MKHRRKVYAGLWMLLAVLLCIQIPTISAQAMSKANQKAHKAFAEQLKKDKKKFCSFSMKLKYAYVDVDGDKVDELITYPGFGYCTQIIYDYRGGKVKDVCCVGQGTFTKYYKKNKVIFINDSGHMGCLGDYYYKWKNGTYKLAAYKSSYYASGDYNAEPDEVHYYVNNSEVSSAEYKAYTKKLVKGAKAYKFSKIKWKKY